MDLKKFVLVLKRSMSVSFFIAIEIAVLITRMTKATPIEIARKPSVLTVLLFFSSCCDRFFCSTFRPNMQKKLMVTSRRVSRLDPRRAQNFSDVVASKFVQRISEGFGASLRK